MDDTESLRPRVEKAITHVWDFLKDNIPLANTHGAEFISENHWDTFLLPSVQSQLMALDKEQLTSLPLGFQHPEIRDNDLTTFIKDASSCHLENLHILDSHRETCGDSFKKVVAESMCQKKLHEVEIMANAVAGMLHSGDCGADLVVDVGSGKGYLSLELAGHHGIRVLGLDSSQGNTHGAHNRKERLKSRWMSLVAKIDEAKNTGKEANNMSCHCENDSSFKEEEDYKRLLDQYIPVTQFVTPDMNLSSILSQHAMSLCRHSGPGTMKAVIAGLHSCGSLAVSAIKLFITDPVAVGLCLVGCCYHLLEEKDDGNTDEEGCHFPLSQFGKSLGLRLGRNARNLASQSVDRIAESGQLQGEEFYWRALLDILIQKVDIKPPDRIKGVRGLSRRQASFHDYAKKAFEKLGFPLDSLTPESISQVETTHQSDCPKMAAFFQLKLSLAPAIESLILMDRLLYLLEQPSVQKASLVRLFSPVASPRCYAIFASKIKDG